MSFFSALIVAKGNSIRGNTVKEIKQRPFLFIILFYFICFIFRLIEYFVIRTDQSMIGEAFIHKLCGIILLAIALRYLEYRWRDIGFGLEKAIRGILIGLGLAIVVFTVAYSAEMMINKSMGLTSSLAFYATGYAIQGNFLLKSGSLFVVICIVGNIINVVMEEGVFRGLFMKLGEKKYSFIIACLFSSLLFGLWHIAQPLRNALDGVQSVGGASMMALMLVVTSALGGIQYVLLAKLTDSLWAGMAAHFINNASANLLHVVTREGIDSLLTIRITVAQTLSFCIVLILYIIDRRKKAQAISEDNQ